MEAGIVPGEKQVSLRLGNTTLRVKEFYPSGKFSTEGRGKRFFPPCRVQRGSLSVRMSGAPGRAGLSSCHSGAGPVFRPAWHIPDRRAHYGPPHARGYPPAHRALPFPRPPLCLAAGAVQHPAAANDSDSGTLYDGETVEFSSAPATAGPLIASGKIKADIHSGQYKADADIAFALPLLSANAQEADPEISASRNTAADSGMSLHLNQENTKFN